MSPIPAPPSRDVWSEPRALPGVSLNVEDALGRGESQLAEHAGRLSKAIVDAGLERRFRLWNESYQAADAELLYAMTRAHRPSRVLELGSGYSTLVLVAAVEENARDGGGAQAEITSVDPDPAAPVADGVRGVELVRRSATEIPIERFEQLGDGDFLVVDTTHTVKLGSEVNYVVLDVLPRLRAGVVVHFHDIFLPYEYPREWFERRMYFAEQYLLEAFLAGNDDYEVIFPAHAAARADRVRMRRVLPSLADPRAEGWVGPAAFWIRRRP